jgi:Domain of unknown function (DUF6748)
VLFLAAPLALAAGSASGREATQPFYVVRPDPRLCPSPLCGGYWVALANRSRTRCSDGLLRPRCYVAGAVDARRRPVSRAIPTGSLANADIRSSHFGDFGELGVLIVEAVFAPVGRVTPTGGFVRLVDTGIRCVRAPCFFVRKVELNSAGAAMVSGVDLRAAGLAGAELARAEAALAWPGGLLAQGRGVPGSDGGRVFRTTRVFLKEPPPRA